MKTVLFAFLSLVSVALAQKPLVLSSALVAQSKFTMLNKVVGLRVYTIKSQEISTTETLLDFGNGLTCKFPTADLMKLRARKNRIIYVLIQSIKDDEINVVIMGNHVAYDINAKAVYSWQETGDN